MHLQEVWVGMDEEEVVKEEVEVEEEKERMELVHAPHRVGWSYWCKSKNAPNGIYGTKRRVFCCKKKAKHALNVLILERYVLLVQCKLARAVIG